MECKYHPKANVFWQEITETTTHPHSGEEVRIFRDIPVCPDCFEEYTETGEYRYTEKNMNKQLNEIHSIVDEWIESQIHP